MPPLLTRPVPTHTCALQAEAAYTKAVLADTEELQEQLYREMRGRIQEADQSAPVRRVLDAPAGRLRAERRSCGQRRALLWVRAAGCRERPVLASILAWAILRTQR